MASFSVSVVIPVWNQWQFTKACLETLRPTLGVRDEVIVVDNGSEDQTPKGLKQFPWVKVITNEKNRGFAIACNQGAAEAANEIVIFLNNDTLLPSHWIDGLVAPFTDATVLGTGPRSNFVSGPQFVENADYAMGSMSSLRRFAKQWREEHRGQTTETHRLVGFCLAVRRDALEAVGGFDEGYETGGAEDDDLCLRLVQHGGRLLITHESFVHHHGHVTFDGNGLDWFAIQQTNLERFRAKHNQVPAVTAAMYQRQQEQPLLSACMIVKDEAELLPACLDSLTGMVDEVVIYDTGSTDNTVELARSAGATVIEGYWDDDFARARNEALAACNGTWVLHIDADEVLEGDALKFRQQLLDQHLSSTTSFIVDILNLSDSGRHDLLHRATRVFRRDAGKWFGRLHEQVMTKDGNAYLSESGISDVKIVHSGYLQNVVERKNKAERNIRIAQADIDDESVGDQVDKLTSLGRSLTIAGRAEEAFAVFVKARALHTDSVVTRRTLLRSGVLSLFDLGRAADAHQWIDDLEAISKLKDTTRYLRGQAFAETGEWLKTIEQLEGLPEKLRDDDGVSYPTHAARMRLMFSYAALGRWEEAADAAALVATADAHEEPVWAVVVESFWRTGRDMDALFASIPPQHLTAVFGQIVNVDPEACDRALESLWQFEDRRSSVLGLAIRVAPKLGIERALEWSVRIRNIGLGQHCPLLTMSADPTRSTSDRLRAATVAFAAFADQAAVQAFKSVASTLATEDFETSLYEVQELAPQLLEPLVTSVATDAPRAVAMGKLLHRLGADDEGVALTLYGLEKGADPSVAEAAAAWLESVGRTEEAATARASRPKLRF